ncbi:ABC transporter substrate-binding protein [Enterovibrio sp. ZSDZ35]|uniref:ABC transporter substrate-binding protein n=1 Tax=Enterovibrio qingdaonensis TaxID=2899818 RepID=A0ABT5QGA9_9GAMM|nr:ABC transporter substrate-binding protein [Enterovibrio sp. ZSDZ35]MDD1780013.1 ABC transporter substrate-binding protein [Enterovibrio sp. ZSDZ35]
MNKKTLLAALILGGCATGSVSADAVKQGGTLNVPIITTSFVDNFNPYTSKDVFHGTMFEPLVVFNNMTGETHYRLAESLDVSDDLKTITLTLRDGLKWSDENPLTSGDVAFSFELAKSNPAFDSKGVWSGGNLASIETPDERTVVFKLNAPDSTFIWNLEKYHVLPKHIWEKVDNATTFTNPNPVGSGPMTTVKLLKPQQMELCRNPHYYLEGRPYLDCVVFRSYNDNSQIQPALIKGEIDWGSNFIADVESTFVKRDPQHNHFWYPANDAIHLYLNTQKAPFNDVRVRQALSMALDRELIVDLAAYGYPTPNFNAGGIGDLYGQYINGDITKQFEHLTSFDQDKANALLDEAGVVDKDGDGYRDLPDGSPFQFDISVVNGWTDWIQTIQMVNELYDEIGVKSGLKTVDWSVYEKSLRQGTYDVAINWSMVATNPISAYQEYYLSDRVGKGMHAGHGMNSAELDALINSFGQAGTEEEQQAILNQLQTFTAENLPFIPLFSNPTWFQYRTKNIAGWPTEENPYIQPVWYDGGKRVIILNNLHLR